MAVPGRKANGVDFNKNENSEDISAIFCQPCDENEQQLQAVGFCVDCREYLCDACFTHHCRARPFRHHVLQDRTIMPRNLDQKKASDMTGDACNEHQREIIKFHCGSHDYFGCAICIAVDHHNCEGVIYVEKEYELLSTTLNDLKEQIVSNERNIEDNVECIEQHYSDAIVRIGQFRKELNGLLDKLEHEMNNKAKTIKDEDQAVMSSISTKMNDMKSEINSSIAEINTLHNLKNNRKLFAIIDKTKDEMKRLDNTLTQMQNENTTRRYVFKPEKQLNDLFENLKSIGSLSVMNRSYGTITPQTTAEKDKTFDTRNQHHHHHHQQQQQQKQQQQQQMQQQQKAVTLQTGIYYDNKLTQTEYATDSKLTQTENSMDSKETQTQACQYARPDKLRVATHISDINVKSPNDEMYVITGSVLLPGNQLVIVDFNNKSVKLVNTTQNTITCEMRQPSGPWDVTMINNSKVAVTLLQQRAIRLLSVVSQSLSEDRDIKVNGQCYGIVYNDGTLIVTFVEPRKVEIINMSGVVLRSVVNDASGVKLFKHPQYIAINPDRSAIYVSDYDNHSVTCMTLGGKVKAVYTDDNLKNPNGMATDRTGTVYVCGIGSNNIHQITAECTKIQILLDQQHGISKPESITYCDQEDKLYVAMWNNNVMKTFQLK